MAVVVHLVIAVVLISLDVFSVVVVVVVAVPGSRCRAGGRLWSNQLIQCSEAFV